MSQIFHIHASKDNPIIFFTWESLQWIPFWLTVHFSTQKMTGAILLFCYVRIFTLYWWIWFCVETSKNGHLFHQSTMEHSTQLTSFSYISVSFARLMISWRLQNVFFRFHSKPLVRNLLTFLVKDCLFCWSRTWMEHLTWIEFEIKCA